MFQNIKIKDVISYLEKEIPLALQEDYDNCGLQTGDPEDVLSGILITLDVTPEVIEEALQKKCNFIISHHPITLTGIKKMTGDTMPVKIFKEALTRKISIYSIHTNIDGLKKGVSGILGQKLGLINIKILSYTKKSLLKLVTFVPAEHADKVRNALFEAGAGKIGNYESCSYNIYGEGTFCGDETTNPYVGNKGEIHFEKEIRIETVLPAYQQNNVLKALLSAHPYEEVAYDFYQLENNWEEAGIGIIGELKEPEKPIDFLKRLKEITNSAFIKHSQPPDNQIKKIAVCGGSGSFLIPNAISAKADVFITGDVKYHQFFDIPANIMIADIGHYESEQFSKELFFAIITKKFPNFAVHFSEVNSNPIKYFS